MNETFYLFYSIDNRTLLITDKRETFEKIKTKAIKHLGKKYGQSEVTINREKLYKKLGQLKMITGKNYSGEHHFITKDSVELSEYLALINNEEMPFKTKQEKLA